MRRQLVSGLFVGMLGIAGHTFAEPVQVTAGFHLQIYGESGLWTLIGDGFSLRGGGIGKVSPMWDCVECQAGTPVSLDTVIQTEDFFHFDGRADVQGVHYAHVFYTGRLEFEAGSIAAVPGVVESLPFTFTGTLTGHSTVDRMGPPLFSMPQLTGAGTLGVLFLDPPGHLEFDRVRYTFADPIPEPASVILLGSGLAGVLAMRRRRRG